MEFSGKGLSTNRINGLRIISPDTATKTDKGDLISKFPRSPQPNPITIIIVVAEISDFI